MANDDQIAEASTVAKIIGENLERARKRANLTQRGFAEALNLSVSAYRHYAKGRHLFPSDLLVSAACLLHVTVEQLLGIPDPATLDEDERFIVESRRAIRSPRIRQALVAHTHEQFMIDQELQERTDRSMLAEGV